MKTTTRLAALLCACTLTHNDAHAQDGPPPAMVRLDAAQSQEVVIMRTVSGDLAATRRSMVAAKEEGRVIDLRVEAGDTVTEGQVLAQLDATLSRLDVTRLEAILASTEASRVEARANLRQAQRDLERLTDARNQGSVADSEIEDAEIVISAMEALVRKTDADAASAQAALDFAKQVVEDYTIRAPFAGQVVRKNTELGNWLDRGGSVVELVALDTIDAYIDVPETYLAAMTAKNASVQADIPAIGAQVTSGDVTVIPAGDELARTFPVRVRFDNPDGALRPGMSVRAMVPTRSYENATTIHKDAILRDDAGAFAYFDAGGQALPVRFDIRWYVGDRAVVASPRVNPGMRFIIEGNERLFPTAPIVDMEAAPATDQTQPEG
ncbi:MAG: efflux RND transporter periplasmic adaptor subunit [Planctomycetota bacterium]